MVEVDSLRNYGRNISKHHRPSSRSESNAENAAPSLSCGWGVHEKRNLRSLAPEGHLIQVAFQQGAKTELNSMPILIKRLTFSGLTLRPRSVEKKAAIAQTVLKNVWPLLETGKVRPIIHAVFSLADTVKTHELMEISSHIGKIMLKVRAGSSAE